ncbi:MAG: MerR family transcriptional regulator [Caulobacteraceae bacterium]|nr:MerR family transcriptional regulator [Caulobacter sp.]
MAPAKGPQAYRSISEAAEEVGVAPHVLRFWEQRFSFIRPMTRSGGRRFYRPQDLEVLRGVRILLHEEGYTIKGVQRLHREEGVGRLTAAAARPVGDARVHSRPEAAGAGSSPSRPAALGAVLADLERAKRAIDQLLATPRS